MASLDKRGRSLARWVLFVALLLPALAFAHGLDPGVLSLVEQEPGRFAVSWTPPVDTQAATSRASPSFPTHCQRTADTLDCGAKGLVGRLAFDDLSPEDGRVVVSIHYMGGDRMRTLVTGETPHVDLEREDDRSLLAWVDWGASHVLGGADHLAFLAGLVLLVGARALRPLAITITAFTLGHALSLAAAWAGLVPIAARPVEALIGLSIMLVAKEALTRRASSDRSQASARPWQLAGAFGLIHGLGMAGAVSAWLPEPGDRWSALLGFNVGVELAGLALVLLAAALARVVPARHTSRLRSPACYALGVLGAFWLISRTI